MSFVYYRLLRKELVELTCSDKATKQSNHTNSESDGRGYLGEDVEFATNTCHSKAAYDCACRTAQAVKKSNHFGHFDHLNLYGKDNAEYRAESKTYIKRPRSRDTVIHDSHNDCKEHGDCANSVADFAYCNFAHHCDTDKNRNRKSDCSAKVEELAVFARKNGEHDKSAYPKSDNDSNQIDKAVVLGLFLSDHTKHSISYHKSADNVYHSERDSDRAKNCRQNNVCLKENCRCGKRTKYGYATKRVHTRHKRGVEQARNVFYYEIAYDSCYQKNAEQYKLKINLF